MKTETVSRLVSTEVGAASFEYNQEESDKATKELVAKIKANLPDGFVFRRGMSPTFVLKLKDALSIGKVFNDTVKAVTKLGFINEGKFLRYRGVDIFIEGHARCSSVGLTYYVALKVNAHSWKNLNK